MRRTLVISDIHGELEKFEQLLGEVEYDPENDQLIYKVITSTEGQMQKASSKK